MKTWHAVAGVGLGLGAIALGARILRPKKRCTLDRLTLLISDRDLPESQSNHPDNDPWRPIDVEPVVLGGESGYEGPVYLGLPSRYNRPGIALFGVSSEVLSIKLRKGKLLEGETGHPGWYLTIDPKQLGTTTFAVGDETGALEHVGIAFSDLKGSFGKPCAA